MTKAKNISKDGKELLFFRELASSSYNLLGQDFFEDLLKQLTKACELEIGLVGELVKDSSGKEIIKTRALVVNGEAQENFSYELVNTPCNEVIEKKICTYQKDICKLFPKDQILIDLKAESYVGSQLCNSEGEVIGLVALIGLKKIKKKASILKLFEYSSGRAAVELERLLLLEKQSSAIKELNEIKDELLAKNSVLEQTKQKLELVSEQALNNERLKTIFLAKVSHELRTPLNGLLGMLQLALQEELSSEVKEYCEIAYQSGDILLSLLQELLDITKIESGSLELVEEPFDLGLFLKELKKNNSKFFLSIQRFFGIYLINSLEYA